MRQKPKKQEEILSNVCAFVMHLDIGISARNENAEVCKRFFAEHGVQILSSEVKYYSDVITAISGCEKSLGIKTQESIIRGFYPFPQTSGQIGIYHSFLNAINDFLLCEKEFLIVIEDDFRMSRQFFKNLTALMSFDPRLQSSLIKLYTVPQDTRYFIRKSLDGATLKTFTRDCTAAMMISKKAAELIVEDILKFGIRLPLDWYLFNFREFGDKGIKFDSYELNPFFVKFGELIDEASDSTLSKNVR